VGVEGDPVDDGGDEAGSGKTVPHSLNGRSAPDEFAAHNGSL
jgi:hypothetical protein